MGTNGTSCHVAIIGAGPYGLAAAAHLRAQQIETRIFGEPMEFWERHMPRGMCLRSSPSASNLADPEGRLSLARFHAQRGLAAPKPTPIADFVAYGHWFQTQAVPDVDRRTVTHVAAATGRFRVRLRDGEEFQARRVVVATGISPFAKRPPEFSDLPPALASHTFDHADLGRFARKRVVVLGGGQSALESAALLHEAGAEVEVIARAPGLYFIPDFPHTSALRVARRLLGRLARPPFDIMGPRWVSWLIAAPRLFRHAPKALQDRLTARAVRPAGASWLVSRLTSVALTTGRTITAATPTDSELRLRLSDGSERRVDHLLLATGYRVDVTRYAFLAPAVRAALRTRDGYPALRVGFESSVPGLHFLGTPAADTFGPLCRFVVGTGYAARALTRSIGRADTNGHRPSVGPAPPSPPSPIEDRSPVV